MNAPEKRTDPVEPGWRLSPEDVDEPPNGLTQRQLHENAARAYPRLWKATGRVSSKEDEYFAKPEGFKLFWKPLALTLACGVPGLLLFVGQFWLDELVSAFGYLPLREPGLLKLGLMLSGALLLVCAAPLFKPAGWTPERQAQLDRDHQYFSRKRG